MRVIICAAKRIMRNNLNYEIQALYNQLCWLPPRANLRFPARAISTINSGTKSLHTIISMYPPVVPVRPLGLGVSGRHPVRLVISCGAAAARGAGVQGQGRAAGPAAGAGLPRRAGSQVLLCGSRETWWKDKSVRRTNYVWPNSANN